MHKRDKILFIIALLIIGLVLIILGVTPPATEYEADIYAAYPKYFWLLIVVVYFIGTYLIMEQVFKNEVNKRSVFLGVCIIIFVTVLLVCIRTARGYVFANPQDLNVHYGFIQQIIINGTIGNDNYYPIIHIMSVMLSDLTGCSIVFAANAFDVTIRSLLALGVLICVKLLFGVKPSLVAFILASIPVFSFPMSYFHPSTNSIYLVPLVLYFYFKRLRLLENRIILLLITFSIVFMHPTTTIFMFVLFISMATVEKIYKKETSPLVALIVFISFFAWYFSFSSIGRSFEKVVAWLLHENELSLFERNIDLINRSGLSVLETIMLFINKYGNLFFYLLVIFLCIVFVVKYYSKLINNKNLLYIMQIGACLVGSCIWAAFLFFGPELERDVFRVSRYVLVVGFIFIGMSFGLYFGFNCVRVYKPIIKFFSLCLIGFVIYISIFNYFPSPRIVVVNHQVPKKELVGVNWLQYHYENSVPILRTGVKIEYIKRRFPELNQKLIVGTSMHSSIPKHFGYNEYDRFFESVDFKPCYLVTSTRDKKYVITLPKKARQNMKSIYDEEDFVILDSDPTVVKIYNNGELETRRTNISEGAR